MRYLSNAEKSQTGLTRSRRRFFLGLISFLVILVIGLFFPKNRYSEYNYQVDDIVRETVIAPFDYPILKTEIKLRTDRLTAKKSVPIVFKENKLVEEEQIAALSRFISSVTDLHQARKRYDESLQLARRNRYSNRYSELSSKVLSDSSKYFSLLKDFRVHSKFDTTSHVFQYLVLNKGKMSSSTISHYLLSGLEQTLRDMYAQSIIDIKKTDIISDKIILLQGGEELLESPTLVITLEEAWRKAKILLQTKYPSQGTQFINVGYDIIINYLKPNLIYQRELTVSRQQAEIDKVPPSRGMVLKDEKIVDANTRVTEDIYQKLFSLSQYRARSASLKGGIRKELPLIGDPLIFVGQLGLITLILSFFITFLKAYKPSIFKEIKLFILIGITFVLQSGLTFLFVDNLKISAYSIPITIAAMTLTILFDSRIAFTGMMTLSILTGVQLGGDIFTIISMIFVSSFAIYSVHNLRKRSQVFRSIIFIILGYAISIPLIELLQFTSIDDILNHMLYAGINGLLSPFLTYGLIGLLESAFGITTDLSLLELADFNHPLLKRLSREATGTFTHSVTVGNLAEAAADAIGANALLTRIGSYYHDIGKMVKPEYFVENQGYDNNKHDSLPPNLSALIITNHIKEGLKLAKDYNLPQAIVDFIPSHHGTTRVEYFYHKALEKAEDASQVNPADFQYDGPKPQTKETGIVMICESIEAAIRSIDKPTVTAISKMIDKVIQKKLSDGQLDDCPLTFADLGKLKGDIKTNTGILPILKSIHHLRVEYPGQNEPEEKKKPEEPDLA